MAKGILSLPPLNKSTRLLHIQSTLWTSLPLYVADRGGIGTFPISQKCQQTSSKGVVMLSQQLHHHYLLLLFARRLPNSDSPIWHRDSSCSGKCASWPRSANGKGLLSGTWAWLVASWTEELGSCAVKQTPCIDDAHIFAPRSE